MGDLRKQVMSNPLVHALAGGIGGMVALSFTYPLDIIKTRLQVQSQFSHETPQYKGTLDAAKKIVDQEGIVGLYKGLVVGLLHTLVNQFVYFYFYEKLKPAYHRGDLKSPLSTFMQLLLGIHAAALNCLVTIPIAVASTRIQTSNDKETGVIGVFVKIVKEDGIQGLWSGLQPSLILSVNPAITHLFYERFKHILTERARASNPKAHITSLETFVIGALSKTISTILTYPYILAKVRLQWKSTERGVEDLKYKGILDVLNKVIREDGVLGVFKGMAPQIVKGVLSQAILFMMKEEIMGFAVRLMLIYYGAGGKKAPGK